VSSGARRAVDKDPLCPVGWIVVKPLRVRDAVEVVYSEDHWRLLGELRSRAVRVMEAIAPVVEALVIGSVARGDVHVNSDVDIALLDPVAPSIIEERLADKGFNVEFRELVQATPRRTPRLYVHLGDNVRVSIPLTRLTRLEEEFYKFAGSLTYSELRKDLRVPGVNKRLLLIVPTELGHLEFSIVDEIEEAARILGVSQDVVRERVEMLLRRDERGRSGLYLRVEIPAWESAEEVIRRVSRRIPALRKILSEWI